MQIPCRHLKTPRIYTFQPRTEVFGFQNLQELSGCPTEAWQKPHWLVGRNGRPKSRNPP